MVLKIGIFKNFTNFIEKHLCWSLFLINLQAWGLQIYQKKTPTQVLSIETCESFKNTFSYRTPLVDASVK